MTTRRQFLGGAAATGAVFCSCHLLDQRIAHAQPAPRRQVVVNGRRVRTVDIHAHVAFAETNAMLGEKPNPPTQTTMADRLKAMDEQGIDVEALSINAYWYKADRDVAQKLIAMQNEKLAEFCAAHPERFVAFASVALQHPDLAAQQLEEAVKKYGLRGAAIGGSVDGQELADPKFHPFWAKVEQLGVLVFIHPQATGAPSELGSRFKGSGGLDNVIGNPLETTIALSHLIFEGTLDQFPGLKICAAHGGGYLPSYAARSDAVHTTFPDRITRATRKKPTEYLRQLYYDSIVFTSEALRHLAAETGSGQIVMGTDYPFPWTRTSVDHILGTPGLTDDERIAILGGTAARLLGIKS
jgi:aminocarboxymuconate-semialdehyde decarboxylase